MMDFRPSNVPKSAASYKIALTRGRCGGVANAGAEWYIPCAMTIFRPLRALLLTVFLLCAALPAAGQFTFLPTGTHVPPFRANIQEARIGVDKFLDRGEMKVDVGNAIDLFAYDAGATRLSAGIDFFAAVPAT